MSRVTKTIDSLNLLAELRAKHASIDKDKQRAIARIYTPEIKAKVEVVGSRYDVKAQAVSDAIGKLEDAIRSDTVKHGSTIRGTELMAVWANGRVTWDTRALDGYAVAHPEINKLRKQGGPSVSIRRR